MKVLWKGTPFNWQLGLRLTPAMGPVEQILWPLRSHRAAAHNSAGAAPALGSNPTTRSSAQETSDGSPGSEQRQALFAPGAEVKTETEGKPKHPTKFGWHNPQLDYYQDECG